ncbi:hypothetical protein AB0N31_20035 [Streptomyces sp. NPDC051051]|uniref:hypothetical protein n=1 Tax=Streptomyces sp. NPDC051051 TaxID=3155666 RepID=UPI00342F9001
MADDRCVFPGDAGGTEPPAGPAEGRSTGRWLTRETAERLLDGETADNAVAPAHRHEADRLARTLGALAAMSAPPAPEDEELPGEAAALAAFRKVRADRAPDAGPAFSPGRAAAREPAPGDEPGFPYRPAPVPGEDAGLVRIGGPVRSHGRRPRLRRPARLGLAAALTVGMVGGVAVAAGTGLLPTPFDDAEPGPAASVSAAATPGPDRPLGSPTPGASPGGTGPATPDGGTRGTSAPGPDGSADDSGARADDLAASCREKGAGRALAAERRRTLERAAGGSARVPAYCAGLLGDREGQDLGRPDGGKTTDEGDGDGDEQGGGQSAGQSGGTTGKGSESRGGKKSAEGEKADKGAKTGKGAAKADESAVKESAKKDGKGAKAP